MSTFDYRRRLTRADLVQAIGVGVGVGVAAAYVAQLLIRRTPLNPGVAATADESLQRPGRSGTQIRVVRR